MSGYNALSDREHPCQIMADILSYEELRGDLRGRKIAWVGDCNECLQLMGGGGANFLAAN